MATVKPDLSQQWASDGDKIAPSGAKIQAGWGPEIPPYQWENFIQNRQDEMLAYLNERGIPEWDNRTNYVGDGKSYVQGSDGVIYKSVTASGPATTTQDPTTANDEVYWVRAFQEVGSLTVVTTSQTLTSDNIGTVLISAGADITVTLPPSAGVAEREVLLQRRDTASFRVTIEASGSDTIMLDTTVDSLGQTSTELLFAGDFLRLRSDGAGKWWCVGQAQLPGSIASGMAVFSTAGLHTFNVPAVLRSGRRKPFVSVTGGGGGGGRRDGATNTTGGGGGGAGGYTEGFVDLTGVASVPVTVGAGGTGRTTDGNGNPGTSSSFHTYMSATGGTGGTSTSGGGSSGTGAGGQANYGLGDGGSGIFSQNALLPGGGAGGGRGGRGFVGGVSANGQGPGGGGGGSGSGTSGSGYQGEVRVVW